MQNIDFLMNQVRRIGTDLEAILNIGTNELWEYSPIPNYQKFKDFFLHTLRSFEYYTRGIASDNWDFLQYGIDDPLSLSDTKEILMKVRNNVETNLNLINQTKLNKEYSQFNLPTTGLNLIIEVIEHAAHHIGQLTIYLRMNNIKPPTISYII